MEIFFLIESSVSLVILTKLAQLFNLKKHTLSIYFRWGKTQIWQFQEVDPGLNRE